MSVVQTGFLSGPFWSFLYFSFVVRTYILSSFVLLTDRGCSRQDFSQTTKKKKRTKYRLTHALQTLAMAGATNKRVIAQSG